jgi:hypothetical protein
MGRLFQRRPSAAKRFVSRCLMLVLALGAYVGALASTSSDSTLQVTAVRPTGGNVTIVLANTGRNSHTVTINLNGLGSPPASVMPYRTSASENQAPLGAVPVSSGAVTITVPSKSVVTLVG